MERPLLGLIVFVLLAAVIAALLKPWLRVPILVLVAAVLVLALISLMGVRVPRPRV